jgi:GNAT superfamily N-acetyltransferase
VQSELTYAILPAGPGDAGAVARVHVEAWRQTYAAILSPAYLEGLSVAMQARRWRRRLMHGSEFTLVAEDADGVFAYCSGDWSQLGGEAGGEGEIHTLYVLRKIQGQGVGRALMTAAARVLAARGANTLVIWVLRDNAPARAFYERMGGTAEDVSGEWVAGELVASVGYRWRNLKGWLSATG